MAQQQARKLQKLPDNFGTAPEGTLELLTDAQRAALGLDANAPSGDDAPTADVLTEPDAEGYVRPEHIGPTQAPPVQVIGQSVDRQSPPLREPRSIHNFTPEELGTIVEPRDALDGLAPLDRSLACPNCGSRVGVFYRDQFTGAVRHQGCAPNARVQGVQQPPRATPQTAESAEHPREFKVSEAKAGMKPPDEVV